MKRLAFVAILLAAPIAAHAEDTKIIHLDVTTEELGIIGAALEAMPYRTVSALMSKLSAQARAQVQPPAAAPAAKLPARP